MMKEIPIEVKPIFRADNEDEVEKMTYILRQLLLVRNGNYTKDDPFYIAIQRERMGEISELESKLDTAMIQLRFIPPPHSPEYANNVAPYPYNISVEVYTRCYRAGAEIKIHNIYREGNTVYARVTILNYLASNHSTPVPVEQLCGEATPNKELRGENPEKCAFVSEESIDGLRTSDTKLFELKTQVGGNHYAKCAIQPIDYIIANRLDYLQGNVIKYVTRYKNKNGVEDLEKAAHYLRIMIEREKAKDASNT